MFVEKNINTLIIDTIRFNILWEYICLYRIRWM